MLERPATAGATGKCYNTTALYGPDGKLVASYRKIHLFDVDVEGRVSVRESRTRMAGDALCCVATDLGIVGLAICYDLRFPELFRGLVDAGAEIIVMPSAFTAPTGRAHWHALVRARAIESQCFVVAPDQHGASAMGFENYGHSLIVDPWGEVLADAGPDGPALASATLDGDALDESAPRAAFAHSSAARPMKRFLDLVTADQATAHLGAFLGTRSESIDARRALGRVAAGEIRAREDIPHFFRSNMDGYAVRAADTLSASPTSAVELAIVGTVLMGEIPSFRVEPGTAARISTGGMMPAGADAVVIVERTEELPRERVAIRESVSAGDSTVAIGEDLHAGDLVFTRGHRFRAADVGVLTGVGHWRGPKSFCVPRAGVIATGDEIVEPEAPLPPGRVRNVNEYLLSALATKNGAVVADYGVIGDDLDLLRRTLERALSENDAVFISGGSSKGAKDSTRGAIEALGAEILFHGVSIAPGKPTILARLGEKAIMGLPGNPAAVAVSFTLFGGPLLRVLGGEPLERILLRRPRIRARIAVDLAAPDGRDDYIRVRLEDSATDLPTAHPQRGKSVALSTIARADGLVRVAAASKGFRAQSEVEVLLLD